MRRYTGWPAALIVTLMAAAAALSWGLLWTLALAAIEAAA